MRVLPLILVLACRGDATDKDPFDPRADDTEVQGSDTDAPTQSETDTEDPVDTEDTEPEDLDLDGDGYPQSVDCDDGDNDIYPGASERCDGEDEDCDGVVDEDATDADVFHADVDGDGYGDPDVTHSACELSSGYVSDDSDCDDADAAVSPDGVEDCDVIDDDCDGTVDEDATDALTWYADADGDGFGDADRTHSACEAPTDYVSDATDCDDDEATTSPGADEVCDEVDNDCDSGVDEGVLETWYLDYDGDGYGDDAEMETGCTAPTSKYVDVGGDCDDTSTAYGPDATPGCDGEDYDCDGLVDSDADGDGYADAACGGDDCDDDDTGVYPEVGGLCALGTTCLDVQDNGYDDGDGTYVIDPDGYDTGLDPFEVYCDMTTDGGGWTEIAYDDDLTWQRQFTGGDSWQWLPSDFTFTLTDAQIEAIQALSTEGTQEYVGLCEHVIHYYYNDGANYDYAFGFQYFDGTTDGGGSPAYDYATVTQDGCATNGGEGGTEANATVFTFETPLVPILNVYSRDNGDASEYFGSPLTSNPAWLR